MWTGSSLLWPGQAYHIPTFVTRHLVEEHGIQTLGLALVPVGSDSGATLPCDLNYPFLTMQAGVGHSLAFPAQTGKFIIHFVRGLCCLCLVCLFPIGEACVCPSLLTFYLVAIVCVWPCVTI